MSSPADAALFRPRLRALAEQNEGNPFQILYAQEDVTYAVYARDVLPFEDERGLVRPPGIDWGVE